MHRQDLNNEPVAVREGMEGSRTYRIEILGYVAALILLVVIVYFNSLSNGFVFDDDHLIENNPAIRSAKYIKIYFVRPFFSVGQPATGPVAYDYYRPLVLVSYLVDYLLWEYAPRGYHITNIFLHALTTLVAFLLLCRLTANRKVSLIAAALFAIHPALADSVAGVSGRSDPLCALFFLISIYCYVRVRQEPSRKSIALLPGSYIAFSAALLSKENAIVLPFVLTAYELLRPDTVPREKPNLKMLFPGYLILLGYLVLRSRLVPASVSLTSDFVEIAARVLTMAKVVVHYAYLMFFPHNLVFETFTDKVSSIFAFEGIIPAILILFGVCIALLTSRKSARGVFFFIWFLACQVPFSFFFLFRSERSFFTPPHFLYLSSIGLAALCGIGMADWAPKRIYDTAGWRRNALSVFCVLLIFFFSVQTVKRNMLWRDDFTFFSEMLKCSPQSSRVHIGMGNSFLEAGHPAHALAEYARAYALAHAVSREEEELLSNDLSGTPIKGWVTIANYYAGASLAGMGDTYRIMGEMDNAIGSYERARSENAFDATIHFKIAQTYEGTGHFDKAIDSYERAFRLDRGMQKALSSVKITSIKKEVYEQCRLVYNASCLYDQANSADALYSQALMMRLSGEPKISAALLRETLEKQPAHFGANLALGQMLAEMGNGEEALANLSVAFAVEPNSALAAYEVAVTRLTLGETLAAEQWAAKAYELDPTTFYGDFHSAVRRRMEEHPQRN